MVGATGTLGRAVAAALERRGHDVVGASRRGALRVDLADPASLDRLWPAAGALDAVVSVAASAPLVELPALSAPVVAAAVAPKLLGQVALLRGASEHLRDGGVVVLTAGRFDAPTRGSAVGALVNAGLEAFVTAVAPELPRGVRAVVVSPGWVSETLAALGHDPEAGTPAADLARGYAAAVEGPPRER